MCCHSKLCASTANYVTQAPSAPQYRADDYSPPPINAASDDDDDYDETEREPADTDWLTLCDGAFEDPSTLIRPASDGDEPPTLAEVMLTVLDWFASHKATEHWYTEPESGRARRKRKWVVVLVERAYNTQ